MKDVFTFLHDANARNDGRMLALRAEHGLEGYGFYFSLLEMMRESSDYKLHTKFMNGYALQIGLDSGRFNLLLDSCVAVELLSVENGEIFSPAFLKRMHLYESKRATLRANALQKQSKCKPKGKQMLSKSEADVYLPVFVQGKEEGECEREKENQFTALGEHFRATEKKLAKLVADFGKAKADYYIQAFNGYIAQNPATIKKYKDHVATVRNWERRDASELKGFHSTSKASVSVSNNNHPARKPFREQQR